MEKECWAAIETNYQLLYTHLDVLEIVSYLKVPLAQYKDDLDNIATSSIHPHELHLIDYMNVGELDPENDLWFFLSLAVGGKAAINCSGRGRSCSGLLRTAEYQRAQDLLSYIKHIPCSFDIFCEGLIQCCQGFLSKALKEALGDVVEVDSPSSRSSKLPASREKIFSSVKKLLFEKDRRINIYGLRGVGTSWFTKQILAHLKEEYYFRVFTINAISTPLPLQKEHFKQYLEEISELQSYEKKFSIIWFDNIDSDMVRNDSEHKYQQYQKKVFEELVGACQKKRISCIFTSRNEYPKEAETDMINFQLNPLQDNKDLERIIISQFPCFSNFQCQTVRKLGHTNPLELLLASSLYSLCDMDSDNLLCCYCPNILNYQYNESAGYDKTIRNLAPSTKRRSLSSVSINPLTSIELIRLIFGKLSEVMKDVVIVMCSVRCECNVSHRFITSIVDQAGDGGIASAVAKLAKLQLLHVEGDLVSINSNLYFLFRKCFTDMTEISHKRYQYYIGYCNYYLDYTLQLLNLIEASSISKGSEWQGNICTVAAVLNPPDCHIEQDLIERTVYKEQAKALYDKRVLVVNRLQQVDLHFPDNELIFAIDFLLNTCKSLSYTKAMDRFTLLCSLTKLFINRTNAEDNIEHANYFALEAIKESERLKKANKSLKNRLYLELLYNIFEIQTKGNKLPKAVKTLETIRKMLKCSKFKTQRGMRRNINMKLAELNSVLQNDGVPRNSSLEQQLETSEESADPTMLFIQSNMFNGDRYYGEGDLVKAHKYYFAMFESIDEPHKYLEIQERVCWTLGHIKLQRTGQFTNQELDGAIKFYEAAQDLYFKRRGKKKHYITLFIATACLLRGHKNRAKQLLNSIIELTNDNFKMFFALINKDTEHIPSWNNLTAGEKKHASNIAPPLPVNFAMLEEANFCNKYDSLAKEDDPFFIEWPSKSIDRAASKQHLTQAIDSFRSQDVQTWTENDKRLVVYCTIKSSLVEDLNPKVTLTPQLARRNVAFLRPRSFTS